MPQSGTNYGDMDTSSKKYETQSIKDQSISSKIIQKPFQYTFISNDMFNILFSILFLQAVNSRAIDYEIMSTPDILKELQNEIYDGYRSVDQDDYRIVHSKILISYNPYDMDHIIRKIQNISYTV